MSVLAIGTDLVDLKRFEQALERQGQRFEDRLFRPEELSLANTRSYRVAWLGARFAVKEAVAKALGTGFGQGVVARDIEVRGGGGAPCTVLLHGGAKDRAETLGVGAVHISISHTQDHAMAVAVLESSS